MPKVANVAMVVGGEEKECSGGEKEAGAVSRVHASAARSSLEDQVRWVFASYGDPVTLSVNQGFAYLRKRCREGFHVRIGVLEETLFY